MPSTLFPRPALSRERILEVAARWCREHPDRPLALRPLAKEVGVDPMTLYRYFPSREALVEGLLLRGAHGARRWLDEEIARLERAATPGRGAQATDAVPASTLPGATSGAGGTAGAPTDPETPRRAAGEPSGDQDGAGAPSTDAPPNDAPGSASSTVAWQEQLVAWATAWARWCCAYPHLVREMCASRDLGRQVAGEIEPPAIAALMASGLDHGQAERGTWLLADVIHAGAMPGGPGTVSERVATILDQVRFLVLSLEALAARNGGPAQASTSTTTPPHNP